MNSISEENETQTDTDSKSARYSTATYALEVTKAWGLFLVLTYLFSLAITTLTVLPDIDQALLAILHHRSILTHSVLIPAMVLVALRERYLVFQALLFAAFGIHLSADLLSPPVGYGAIWLPNPMKVSLGPFSPVWIAINALAAFYLALNRSTLKTQPAIFWSTAMTAVYYGAANEGNVISIVVILAVYAAVAIPLRRYNRLDFSPSRLLSGTRDQYLYHKNATEEAKKRKLVERAQMGRFKRAFLAIGDVIRTAVQVISAPFRYPKVTAIVFSVLAVFYIAGKVSSPGANGRGVIATVAEGAWVVHSAGGCILIESTGYVPGTYTSDTSFCQ